MFRVYNGTKLNLGEGSLLEKIRILTGLLTPTRTSDYENIGEQVKKRTTEMESINVVGTEEQGVSRPREIHQSRYRETETFLSRVTVGSDYVGPEEKPLSHPLN